MDYQIVKATAGFVVNRLITALIKEAKLINRENREVELSWSPDDISFAELVEASGEVPLPPYLNREAEEDDKLRYQTVYSDKEGAVAAPTAGLHFTDKTFEELKSNGISVEYLTLHTGAGTFQPSSMTMSSSTQCTVNKWCFQNKIF